MLCAPSTGSGKTTVICALLQALVQRGLNPAAFKCGPDYIDSMFHSEIIGAESSNLDLFMLGDDKVRRILVENSRNAGISVFEGVMGYYDGIGLTTESSSYMLAAATQTPAVLVVDAGHGALSVAALIQGLHKFREPSWIQGVILNRVSSAMYPRMADAVEQETGLKVFGFMPDLPDCTLHSRHLGLVTASEVDGLREMLRKLAAQAESSVDIGGLIALASGAPDISAPPINLPTAVFPRPRIAIAKDKAFCFYYRDSLALLEQLGAELVPFSPLDDCALPNDTSGLYLGGGYPELFADKLSANSGMLSAVKSAIDSGMPCIAECGGFLYLHDSLEDSSGNPYPMVGAVHGKAFKTTKLSRFGYVTLTAFRDSILGPAGTQIPAHEFHYWDSTSPGDCFTARKPLSERQWDCAIATDSLYAGFPHMHLLSNPDIACNFVSSCRNYKEMIS